MRLFDFPDLSAGWRHVACTLLLALLAAPSTVAYADEDDDHERAYRALEQSKVLPLRGLLMQIEREYGGKVVKVDFDDDDGAYVYEMRLLRPHGQVLEIDINAVTGMVLDVEEDD